MAASTELTIDIEGAYSTSPRRTTEPRSSYKVSVSSNESLDDDHHHHQEGVLQKWMHTILCYKKQSNNEDYGLHAKGWIKESLGKALLDQPILAGRLRRSEINGDLKIVSNDSGIRCIDAQISINLVHFLQLSKEKKNDVEGKLLYWKDVDDSNPIFSPLFYIQVTKFKCGGYSIGISCSLLLTDPLDIAKFLNKWAKIHISMVYESEISKTLSSIYSTNFKFGCSEHEYGTIHNSSNTSKKTSKTMVFKILIDGLLSLGDEICNYLMLHCIEEANNKFGIKMGSTFTLITKEPNGNTKVEIFTRKANFVSPKKLKNLKYELKSCSWEDLRINEVAFQEGNGPIDASHWISCDALEGVVLVVILDAIEGKSGIDVYITIPSDQEIILGHMS